MNKFFAPLVAVLLLSVPAAQAMATGIVLAPGTDNVLVGDNDQGIHIDGTDVVIDNHRGDEARIAADGSLTVNDKTVVVTGQQKQLLQRYNQTVKDIKTKGINLGKHAVSFAMSVVGETFAALFSGESEQEINRRANAEADKFKLKALPICKDVQSLKHLQDLLVAGIPAFKPFDMVKAKDANDCENNIKSSD